jgi:hypothetical protein
LLFGGSYRKEASIMRGSREPAVRHIASETQVAFRTFSRGRRTKLARLARTTLVKADQWARGEGVGGDVSEAIEATLKAFKSKKK